VPINLTILLPSVSEKCHTRIFKKIYFTHHHSEDGELILFCCSSQESIEYVSPVEVHGSFYFMSERKIVLLGNKIIRIKFILVGCCM
jgi:hypothetical protein